MKRSIITLLLSLLSLSCGREVIFDKSYIYIRLSEHYSPIYIQSTASTQDYITSVDFDGNLIGIDNWENQPLFPQKASVYYSIKETETHYFISYGFYHPRDWLNDCDNHPVYENCHEHDSEQILLIVEKDGTDYGKLLSMETQAHFFFFVYIDYPWFEEGGFSGTGIYKNYSIEKEESHPIVYSEAFGHGIYGNRADIIETFEGYVPTIYEFNGVSESPSQGQERVSYSLISIYDTLWKYKDNVELFSCPFEYRGHNLMGCFRGDTYEAGGADTFWASKFMQDGGRLRQGDWFLDPAKAVSLHQGIPPGKGYSLEYLYNPYLEEIR